jgi:hypothetical protein
MERELNQNLSGNEVYHTNSLILLVKNMLCSIAREVLISLSFHARFVENE